MSPYHTPTDSDLRINNHWNVVIHLVFCCFHKCCQNLAIVVLGTWYVCHIFATTGSLSVWATRMWRPNLVVNWKKGMTLLPCPTYGLCHVHCKGSQLTLCSQVFSWTDMCHSACALIRFGSTIHLLLAYTSTWITIFTVLGSSLPCKSWLKLKLHSFVIFIPFVPYGNKRNVPHYGPYVSMSNSHLFFRIQWDTVHYN